MMFLGMLGVLISNFLIMQGYYISEQEIFGYDNGAFLVYSLWVLYSIIIIFFLLRLNRHSFLSDFCRPIGSYRMDVIVFYIVIIIPLVFTIYNGLINSFPLLNNQDRYQYWSSQSNLFATFYGQLFLSSFLAGFLYDRSKKSSVLFLISILLLQLLFANKFSALLFSLFLFYTTILLTKPSSLSWRSLVYILFLTLLLLSFSLYLVSSLVYYDSFQEYQIVEKILERLVLQGHVFWGVVSKVGLFNFSTNDFFHEILSAIGHGNGELYGMQKLMVLVGGDVGWQRIEQGADFTMAYPATIYYFSGVIGIFFVQFFYISFYVLILFLIKHAIRNGYILLLIPLGKILISTIGFFGIGNLELLISIKTFFFWFLYLCFLFIYQIALKKRYVYRFKF